MAKAIPEVKVPDWVFDPKSKILGIVIGFIVAGLEKVQMALVSAVTAAWSSVRGALTAAGVEVESAASSAGSAVLDVVALVGRVLRDLAGSAGPAAPLVVAVLGAGTILASLWVLRLLITVLKERG